MLQGMAARTGGEQYLAFRDAYVFWIDDLICRPLFKHPILVDTGGMREGVRAYDGFVGLNEDSCPAGNEPARIVYLRSYDASIHFEVVLANLHGHNHFFDAGIPRA